MTFPSDIPEDMEELLYFTNRKLEDGTKILAWTQKATCTCGKGKLGKPVDEKTGKKKIRAKEYVCPACGHTEEKAEYEAKLHVDVRYSNPEGTEWKSATSPFKRKTWQGVPSYIFMNEFSGEKQGITKKMKVKKPKKTSK